MSTQVFLNLLWVPYRDQESKLGDIGDTQDPPQPQNYTKITSQRLTSFSLTLVIILHDTTDTVLRQPLQEQVQPLQLNHLVLMQQQLPMRYSGHNTHLSHDDFLAIRKR